jgi:hypothetical protein
MAFNYVNKFTADPGPPIVFPADSDTNQAGQGGPFLGPMKRAVSPNIMTDDYATLVGYGVRFTNPTGTPGTESFYVVNPLQPAINPFELRPNAPNHQFNILNTAPNLIAELEFDSPEFVMLDGSQQSTPWTVALLFKTGSETDLGPDVEPRIGVRFTFVDGAVKFKGAGPDQVLNAPLFGFGAFGATKFKLLVDINRTETSFSSNAVGFVGDTIFVGQTDVIQPPPLPQFGMNLVDASTAEAKITAVGVSVVDNGQETGASKVSVRLTAFRLAWDFPELELISIPLIR